MRVSKLYKQGNSAATIVPPSILKTLNWSIQDYIVWQIFEKEVVLTKLDFPPKIIQRLAEKRQKVFESLQEVK